MKMKSPLFAALAGALVLSACTDPAFQTGGERQRTRDGAVAGAIVGGILGAAAPGNDDVKNAAIGAVAGALVGGAIGTALDRQAADLRREMSDERIRIVNTGTELVVTMPQDILFDVDSTFVRPDLRDDLRGLARNLRDYPNSTVFVIGHTDSTGSAAYNQDLSERRARAVAGVLIDAGVAAQRIQAVGRGEDQPVATNLTPEGRAQNRRVEIVIRPN
jgi:outer membrane protein OmpA-like peptidoglycan-associated protein